MTGEYERWRSLLADEVLPTAVVDLDALDANIDVLAGALGDSRATLRVATKSVRCGRLLTYILDRGGERFRGLMTFSAYEVAGLAARGWDDFLMGYPVGRRADASQLAALAASGARLWATVDDPGHVELLERAAEEHDTVLPVCLDVDMSWRPLGGRLHLGVRRSPIRGVEAAVAIARRIAEAPHLELGAVLAYEAQVAGMADQTPTSRYLDPIRRFIKARSRPVVAERRRTVVEALRAEGHAIDVVNGGGTGSVSWTGEDPTVSEVTAGSGFLCSHLFDHYRGLTLRPAVFFAVPVVRRSDPDHVTCGFGGYMASGSPGPDRAPIVHLPAGLTPLPMEGFGEVQTPFRVARGYSAPCLGDPVLCRHAKAGELAEHFETYLLVRGHEVVERVPTYRGEGMVGASRSSATR